jgi:hypothetical protein
MNARQKKRRARRERHLEAVPAPALGPALAGLGPTEAAALALLHELGAGGAVVIDAGTIAERTGRPLAGVRAALRRLERRALLVRFPAHDPDDARDVRASAIALTLEPDHPALEQRETPYRARRWRPAYGRLLHVTTIHYRRVEYDAELRPTIHEAELELEVAS